MAVADSSNIREQPDRLSPVAQFYGRKRCAMACELIVQLGIVGNETTGVRPLYCHVLAAIHAGDQTVGAVAERLELEPNTVWKRIGHLATTYGRGDLVVFPDGKREDRRHRTPGRGQTRIALDEEAKRIAVEFSEELIENLTAAIRKLDKERLFGAKTGGSS